MDSTHRKSPDFGSLENSPPSFPTYEFTDPSNPSFEGFQNYIYTGSPRMDFASLSLSTSGHSHPPHFFANPSAIFNHSASGARTAGGSPTSLGSGPHTPLESITPTLTYPHEASGSELENVEDATGSGSTSPATGRSMPHHQAARSANRYNPIARPSRAASKRSATATRKNLRREEDDMSDDDLDGNTEDPSVTDLNGNAAVSEG